MFDRIIKQLLRVENSEWTVDLTNKKKNKEGN
jgi:hypothetical protein